MKLIKLFIIASMVFVLTACDRSNSTGTTFGKEGNLVDIGDFGNGIDLLRDKNTGCVYIYKETGHQLNISAYYGEDGEVVGCGEEQFDRSKYE